VTTLPQAKTDTWLTLAQAATRLGVHTSTLRRWADQGQIVVMLTPGGHRRFANEDVERFMADHRHLQLASDLEQIWAEQALIHTRTEIVSHGREQWLAPFSAEERKHKRQLGRKMMGLMLQYVSSDEGGEGLLEEARAIGREHAENALEMGLSLTDALQAAMFFRDAVVEVALDLPDAVRVSPRASKRLLRRINTLLNSVQLAIAETYQDQP
jgi:excisionase family DNA binding protein